MSAVKQTKNAFWEHALKFRKRQSEQRERFFAEVMPTLLDLASGAVKPSKVQLDAAIKAAQYLGIELPKPGKKKKLEPSKSKVEDKKNGASGGFPGLE